MQWPESPVALTTKRFTDCVNMQMNHLSIRTPSPEYQIVLCFYYSGCQPEEKTKIFNFHSNKQQTDKINQKITIADIRTQELTKTTIQSKNQRSWWPVRNTLAPSQPKPSQQAPSTSSLSSVSHLNTVTEVNSLHFVDSTSTLCLHIVWNENIAVVMRKHGSKKGI